MQETIVWNRLSSAVFCDSISLSTFNRKQKTHFNYHLRMPPVIVCTILGFSLQFSEFTPLYIGERILKIGQFSQSYRHQMMVQFFGTQCKHKNDICHLNLM